MRLFIADNSDLLCMRLVEMLSEIEGIEIVGQANDAPDAVEAIKRLSPDVVILGIWMPSGNGIIALQRIKGIESPPKVIMFSDYPYPQYREKCMDAGADFFFSKSTEFNNVTNVLKQMIHNNKPNDLGLN